VDVPSMKLSAPQETAQIFEAHVETVARMAIAQAWLKRIAPPNVAVENLGIVTAQDAAMDPTIAEGDILLVDRGTVDVRADAVYCYVLHDDFYVRRLQREGPGMLRVIPDNSKFRESTIQRGEARILGRVLTSWGATAIN